MLGKEYYYKEITAKKDYFGSRGVYLERIKQVNSGNFNSDKLSVNDIKERHQLYVESANGNLYKQLCFQHYNILLTDVFENDVKKKGNVGLLQIIKDNNLVLKKWMDVRDSQFSKYALKKNLFMSLVVYNGMAEEDVWYLLDKPNDISLNKPFYYKPFLGGRKEKIIPIQLTEKFKIKPKRSDLGNDLVIDQKMAEQIVNLSGAGIDLGSNIIIRRKSNNGAE